MVAMQRPGRPSAWEGRMAAGPQPSPVEEPLLLAQRQVAPATHPLPDLHLVNRGQAAEGWALALTRRWRAWRCSWI